MKYLFSILIVISAFCSCEANKKTISTPASNDVASDTIRIANDELEYEIMIFEPGFNIFLRSQPPRGYYDQSFLENRNHIFTTQYNQRVLNSLQYDYNLYPQQIFYDVNTDYGYEVNYMLYNYAIYFSRTYKQEFTGLRN